MEKGRNGGRKKGRAGWRAERERKRLILILKMKDKSFLWTAEMFGHVFSTQLNLL